MPLDESFIPHCSAGDKEILGHRSIERSCWIGVAALQGLLQCLRSSRRRGRVSRRRGRVSNDFCIKTSSSLLCSSGFFSLNLNKLLFGGGRGKNSGDKL